MANYNGKVGPFSLALEGLAAGAIVFLVFVFLVINLAISVFFIWVIYLNVGAYIESPDFWDIFWIVFSSIYLGSTWIGRKA